MVIRAELYNWFLLCTSSAVQALLYVVTNAYQL